MHLDLIDLERRLHQRDIFYVPRFTNSTELDIAIRKCYRTSDEESVTCPQTIRTQLRSWFMGNRCMHQTCLQRRFRRFVRTHGHMDGWVYPCLAHHFYLRSWLETYKTSRRHQREESRTTGNPAVGLSTSTISQSNMFPGISVCVSIHVYGGKG